MPRHHRPPNSARKQPILLVVLPLLLTGLPAEGAQPTTLARSFVDEEYRPEYGTLLLMDAVGPGSARSGPSGRDGPLAFLSRPEPPTIARSGEATRPRAISRPPWSVWTPGPAGWSGSPCLPIPG
jgi:hypothetical protein